MVAYAGLLADELRFPVSHETAGDWNAAGARPEFSAEAPLVIPRDSGIARAFTAPVLAVEFDSKPFFGIEATDIPAIEIGQAALAFVRHDQVGSLVLFTGREAATARWLPMSIPLDTAGRSAKPVNVIFGLALSSALVAVDNEPALVFPLAASRASSSDVAVSAGARELWAFQNLTVVTSTESQAVPADGATASNGAGNNSHVTGDLTEREETVIAELSQRLSRGDLARSHGPGAATVTRAVEVVPSGESSPGVSGQMTALELRAELVEAIRQGALSATVALDRLRVSRSPSGLNLDPDVEISLAALDVGRRLIAAGEATSAEPFFIEAERSLVRLVTSAPGQDTRSRAAHLHRLGVVRADYLGKTDLAAADFAEAIRLQPDDEYLQRSRDSHLNDLGSRRKSAEGGRN